MSFCSQFHFDNFDAAVFLLVWNIFEALELSTSSIAPSSEDKDAGFWRTS